MDGRQIISDWFYKYGNDVYNFLVYYQGSREVQDLVQEVFMRAARGLSCFHYDSSPKTWLFSVARNVAIDHARKRGRRIESTAIPIEDAYVRGNTCGPEKTVVEDESMQELYRIVLSLKSSYRDVLILRGIESMSTRETAYILGWKEEKVKQTYHRAKKTLQKQLPQKRWGKYES